MLVFFDVFGVTHHEKRRTRIGVFDTNPSESRYLRGKVANNSHFSKTSFKAPS